MITPEKLLSFIEKQGEGWIDVFNGDMSNVAIEASVDLIKLAEDINNASND